MGLLDNVLGSAVPGGNLAKPVGAALLALLAYKATSGGGLFGGGSQQPAGGQGAGAQPGSSPQYSPQYQQGAGNQGNHGLGQAIGGVLAGGGLAGALQGMLGGQGAGVVADQHVPGLITGGLSGLLQQFQQSGYGNVINSWIGTGANQPIQPQQLNEALGPETVGNLSRQTGMSQPDLLSQLSQALPQFVDRMTPQGRIPEQHEVSQQWA